MAMDGAINAACLQADGASAFWRSFESLSQPTPPPTLSSGMPGALSTSAASGQAARSTEPSSSPAGTTATSTSAILQAAAGPAAQCSSQHVCCAASLTCKPLGAGCRHAEQGGAVHAHLGNWRCVRKRPPLSFTTMNWRSNISPANLCERIIEQQAWLEQEGGQRDCARGGGGGGGRRLQEPGSALRLPAHLPNPLPNPPGAPVGVTTPP